MSAVVSFLVVGLALRRVDGWRGMGDALLYASGLTLVLVIAAQLTFDPANAGSNVGIAGLTERVLIIEVFAWFVALAARAIRREPARREQPRELAA